MFPANNQFTFACSDCMIYASSGPRYAGIPLKETP